MRIAIGCDHIVTEIKNEVRDYLIGLGHDVLDVGTYGKARTHYPIYGQKVGELVASGVVTRGIVICGTGVGISLSAQKVNGTRVALVGDKETARAARANYDVNVLGLGGRVVGIGAIIDIIDTYLNTEYRDENKEFIAKVNNMGNKTHVDFNSYLQAWEEGKYIDS